MLMLRFLFALFVISASAVKTRKVPGDEVETITDVTFDNSYAEGGEAVTPADLGLARVTRSSCEIVNGTESAELQVTSAHYDEEEELLHLLDAATGKELAKEKDASKVVVRVHALGK